MTFRTVQSFSNYIQERGGGGGGGGGRPWVSRDATSPEGSCGSCVLNNRGERFTNATVIANYAIMTSVISINRSTRTPMIAIAAKAAAGHGGEDAEEGCCLLRTMLAARLL